MHNYKLVKLPKFQVCNFKNKKSTPQKPKKYGAFFAPFSHLLHFCKILSMLNIQKHHNWVSWVMTELLICHKHTFQEFWYFFSMGLFYTHISGSNSRKMLIFFQNITLYDISNHFIIRIIMEKNILVTLKKPYVHLAPQWKITQEIYKLY